MEDLYGGTEEIKEDSTDTSGEEKQQQKLAKLYDN